MTYLKIVNRVLKLLREDTVATVADEDAVVQLVCTYVNDAKTMVEDSFHFNALRHDWDETVLQGGDFITLSDSGQNPTIEEIWGPFGKLKELHPADMRNKRLRTTALATPQYYAVDGQVQGDLRIRIFPSSSESFDLSVIGYRNQDELTLDSDRLLVPSQTVVYYAYALAAREREEVGGQTAAEILGLAAQYLKDAVAHDAALNLYEWTN